MATTTQDTNRAKFLELRGQGMSVADARNKSYGPVPVVADQTPVAPVAPIEPVPISPTASINQQQRVDNIASRQATPAPMATPAPSATPAPVEASVTPTTPTQTPFQQAQAESEKIKAQNEAQMKLNTQQADLKAQERQQVAQETAKANTPVNQKDVLNALVSGVSVAPQNTAAYRNAQMQYKTYQKFATMTPTQLADNMKMGEIGTETAQLLASNPNYIKAKEDFDKFQKNQSINNMIKSVAEGATGKTTAVDHYQNASDAIAKKLGITETNADAFARIVSKDPETLQLTKTVSNIAKQLNTLNTERNAVYEDLKKQYPDLSASAIMTLMAGRTKEATAQIDALNSSLTLTQADLKMAMEMAKAEYDATKEDITLQAGLAKEDRAMQNALDLSQAQFDQKLAQQAQLTNDPVSAIGSVIKQFSDLGIVGDRDLAWHVAEQKRLGMTLPEYTKKMIEDFKAKPEYKAKFGVKPEETAKWGVIGKNTDGSDKYGFIDATKGTVTPYISPTGEVTGDIRYLAEQFPNQAWAKNNNPAGITWNSNFDKGTGTAKLLTDAGVKFSKGTARPANEGGNYVTFATIEDGLKAQQIMMTQTYGNSTVGNMLSSWVGTSEGPNYAKQVAGMAGITDLNQKVSDLSPEQVSALQMAKIQKESPGLAKLLTQGTGVKGTGTFTATEEAWANNIMNGKAKISDITTKDNVDKGKVLQLMNQKTGGTTGTMQTNIQSGLDIVNSLINHPGFTDVVGVPSIFANPLGYSLPATSARDFKAELKRMEAIGFLNMIPQMQGMGALSNSEGSRLAAAYSKLSDTGIGETEYKAELTRLKEGMEKALRNMGATITEEQKQTTNTGVGQTIGGELDYSKYE